MVKNASNELKFDQTCISMSFIKFYKIFENFWKLVDFWQKNSHWARIPRRKIVTFFQRKMYQGLQNCSELAKNQSTSCIMPLREIQPGFFIFWVFAILWGLKGTKGAFLAIFGQKSPFLCLQGLIKLQKLKVSKIRVAFLLSELCKRSILIFSQFWAFLKALLQFPLRKKWQFCDVVYIRAEWSFFGKKLANFENFPKIL